MYERCSQYSFILDISSLDANSGSARRCRRGRNRKILKTEKGQKKVWNSGSSRNSLRVESFFLILLESSLAESKVLNGLLLSDFSQF